MLTIDLNQTRELSYKLGSQLGPQDCAERAVEAVEAMRNVLRKFGAC